MTTTNEKNADMCSIKSAQKAIAWSLFASVILNLFLVVAVFAPPLLGPRMFGPMGVGGPHEDFMIDYLARELGPEDAATLKKSFKAQTDALNKARKEIRSSMDDVARLFEADKADPKALEEAMKKSQLARDQLDQALSKVMLDAYVKLSPEGRHRLSQMKRHHMMRDGVPPPPNHGERP